MIFKQLRKFEKAEGYYCEALETFQRIDGEQRTVGEAVAACPGVSVVGGGDTVSAVRAFGLEGRITHVSRAPAGTRGGQLGLRIRHARSTSRIARFRRRPGLAGVARRQVGCRRGQLRACPCGQSVGRAGALRCGEPGLRARRSQRGAKLRADSAGNFSNLFSNCTDCCDSVSGN